MACRKLKPIEERDPQAARILEAFDRLHGLDQDVETKPATKPVLQLVGRQKPAPKSGQGGYLNLDFSALFAALVIVGVLIGIALTLGVPWLWDKAKPFIHAVTA
ncbi:hypothetical protein GCM10007933_21160 [Zoogloea oryzae]|uniref:Uncharacterized protein n=1 Tax=Zoogloea oryzae TaxID=310767 RepID=A0ABQ6FBK7_9RHOO|nr:hypothetical protein [Zoogloea oryzae]GLT22656.1 hypothetical protein GCM10007933_21160 [Zoogloea oryzae]